MMKLKFLAAFLLLLNCGRIFSLAAEPEANMRTETFERDPQWESLNNRLTPEKIPTIVQDFGYSESNFAGRSKGELGGQVWRATEPAFYGDKISTRTLNDKLTASGTFVITKTAGSSGVFFGWFNAKQPGGGRPVSSLGLDFDCEPGGGRLAVRMISISNKSCGTFITPFIPGKYRPTPIQKNVPHRWKLSYDPSENNGNGRFTFEIARVSASESELASRRGVAPKKNSAGLVIDDDWEGKTFTVDVPESVRKEGVTVDRFGLMNMGRAGNPVNIYFDDLEYDGKTENFSRDPKWEGAGNRVSYPERDHPGMHNYGFSPDTNFAGGKRGEIGGAFWRTEKTCGYYAARVAPLTLNDKLEASGKVILQIGAPDSGMCLGWFSSSEAGKSPVDDRNFLGVQVGGPTRIGHYFSPHCAMADGERRKLDKAPILVPGKIYDWKISYDPSANEGNGVVRATLGSESIELNLKPGDKARGARFDRFGIASVGPGGGLVKLYMDDLAFTAAK